MAAKKPTKKATKKAEPKVKKVEEKVEVEGIDYSTHPQYPGKKIYAGAGGTYYYKDEDGNEHKI